MRQIEQRSPLWPDGGVARVRLPEIVGKGARREPEHRVCEAVRGKGMARIVFVSITGARCERQNVFMSQLTGPRDRSPCLSCDG